MIEDQEEKKTIQLQKYQDPTLNQTRQSYLVLLARFSESISNSLIDKTESLFTDDCNFFLFDSTGRTSVRHCLQPKDLHDFYKGLQIRERIVRETFIDLEKGTVIQLCNFKIIYNGQDNPVDDVVVEIFTITSGKISKYRAFIGEITPEHCIEDPFEISKKEIILRKVKQINYAFAGQPDLEKIASLFNEKTKYKIWSWDSHKFFTFEKHDLVKRFRTEIEENYIIESIIPYEVFTEGMFVYGTYVWHLEKKSNQNKNEKHIWLSTCVYAFDQDLNIIKINQQGEFGLEDELKIPFAAFSREKLIEKVHFITKDIRRGSEVFFKDLVDFSHVTYIFGPKGFPTVGCFKGIEKIESIITQWKEGRILHSPSRCVDVYADTNHNGYDIVVLIHCTEEVLDYPGYKYNGLELSTISVSVFSLANGKLVKTFGIFSEVSEPIISPFDDPSFESVNIKCNEKLS